MALEEKILEYFIFYPDYSPLLGPPAVPDGEKGGVREENKACDNEKITNSGHWSV